jgi:hypothetical protein
VGAASPSSARREKRRRRALRSGDGEQLLALLVTRLPRELRAADLHFSHRLTVWRVGTLQSVNSLEVRIFGREVEELHATSAAKDSMPSPDPRALQRSTRLISRGREQ